MKKILILALLFMGCDYAPTEHSHDRDVVEDRDDSSYELLAWVYVHSGGDCFRIGEYECVYDSFPETFVTVDVQEIRIYNGERYNSDNFVVEITDVDGVVRLYNQAWAFGYLDE